MRIIPDDADGYDALELGAELIGYVCPVCGAIVWNRGRHSEWHVRIIRLARA